MVMRMGGELDESPPTKIRVDELPGSFASFESALLPAFCSLWAALAADVAASCPVAGLERAIQRGKARNDET